MSRRRRRSPSGVSTSSGTGRQRLHLVLDLLQRRRGRVMRRRSRSRSVGRASRSTPSSPGRDPIGLASLSARVPAVRAGGAPRRPTGATATEGREPTRSWRSSRFAERRTCTGGGPRDPSSAACPDRPARSAATRRPSGRGPCRVDHDGTTAVPRRTRVEHVVDHPSERSAPRAGPRCPYHQDQIARSTAPSVTAWRSSTSVEPVLGLAVEVRVGIEHHVVEGAHQRVERCVHRSAAQRHPVRRASSPEQHRVVPARHPVRHRPRTCAGSSGPCGAPRRARGVRAPRRRCGGTWRRRHVGAVDEQDIAGRVGECLGERHGDGGASAATAADDGTSLPGRGPGLVSQRVRPGRRDRSTGVVVDASNSIRARGLDVVLDHRHHPQRSQSRCTDPSVTTMVGAPTDAAAAISSRSTPGPRAVDHQRRHAATGAEHRTSASSTVRHWTNSIGAAPDCRPASQVRRPRSRARATPTRTYWSAALMAENRRRSRRRDGRPGMAAPA